MTEEEMVAMGEGSTVEVRFAKRWVACEVLGLETWDYQLKLAVRRKGRVRDGGLFPLVRRLPEDIRLPISHDPTPANIYADYLEDHGEHRAAAMLREAFPLPVPQEPRP